MFKNLRALDGIGALLGIPALTLMYVLAMMALAESYVKPPLGPRGEPLICTTAGQTPNGC